MLRSLAHLLLLALVPACAEHTSAPGSEIAVRVGSVALDAYNAPVVILEEQDGPRVLPIWIGSAEATSIASEISKRTPPRPNSHDMAKRVIETLDATVERVVVTELRGGTYYAILHLRANGRLSKIDVRPSDGIALALRTLSPILVRASVFDAAGEALGGAEPGRRIRGSPRPGSTPATPPLTL
jgi:bifunctional DNase/RNase